MATLGSSTSTDPSWLEPRCCEERTSSVAWGCWSTWLWTAKMIQIADQWLVLICFNASFSSQIWSNRFWMRIPRIQKWSNENMFHFEHDKKLPRSSSSTSPTTFVSWLKKPLTSPQWRWCHQGRESCNTPWRRSSRLSPEFSPGFSLLPGIHRCSS